MSQVGTRGLLARSALVVIVSMLVAAAWSIVATTARAQTEPYSNNEPDVLPSRIERPLDKPEGDIGGVAGSRIEQRPTTQGRVLPFTGGDVVIFVVIGAAAVVTGTAILRRTRAGESG